MHQPKAHKKHTVEKPCGCWVNGPAAVCPLCKAAYDPREVVTFPLWRCYDCGFGGSPAAFEAYTAYGKVQMESINGG